MTRLLPLQQYVNGVNVQGTGSRGPVENERKAVGWYEAHSRPFADKSDGAELRLRVGSAPEKLALAVQVSCPLIVCQRDEDLATAFQFDFEVD